jgi:hypothetical protein
MCDEIGERCHGVCSTSTEYPDGIGLHLCRVVRLFHYRTRVSGESRCKPRRATNKGERVSRRKNQKARLVALGKYLYTPRRSLITKLSLSDGRVYIVQGVYIQTGRLNVDTSLLLQRASSWPDLLKFKYFIFFFDRWLLMITLTLFVRGEVYFHRRACQGRWRREGGYGFTGGLWSNIRSAAEATESETTVLRTYGGVLMRWFDEDGEDGRLIGR